MTLTIERAHMDEASFRAVYPLLLELHKAVGIAPLNPDKMAQQCYHVLGHGMTFIARDEAGQAVGSIGLIEGDLWYADCGYILDKWFFVRPDHRGSAGLGLLRAARDEGIARDRIVYVWNTNPDKRQKGLPFGVEAQRLGFVPFGYMMRLNRLKGGQSEGGETDVLRERDQIDDLGSRLYRGGGEVPG